MRARSSFERPEFCSKCIVHLLGDCGIFFQYPPDQAHREAQHDARGARGRRCRAMPAHEQGGLADQVSAPGHDDGFATADVKTDLAFGHDITGIGAVALAEQHIALTQAAFVSRESKQPQGVSFEKTQKRGLREHRDVVVERHGPLPAMVRGRACSRRPR